MIVQVSDANLALIPGSVKVPNYNRSLLKPGIIHIGLGNFHRAHQSWYLHRLFELGFDQDWAIIGAGVRQADEKMRERLLDQDCLSTLIELDPLGKRAEIVGSMVDFIPVEQGNGTLISRMAEPQIRIVSLTVTEGGYYIDASTKGFDTQHPDIGHDVENPETPRTAFGAIVAALKIRRQRGLGPFTCLSCDNLQGNGNILKQAIISLAQLTDPALAAWISDACAFPNSMVDCIVPATGPREMEIAREFGLSDKAPVTHENFRQWVIEDKFCAGRPRLEKVGAIFTDRVHDYEIMKLRILNAGHQVIAVPGELLGIKEISECMSDPEIFAFFQKVQTEEIAPHVTPVPGMTPENYVALIAKRFSNAAIKDTVRRVAFDGSSRHPGFVLPIIRDGLKKGVSVQGLVLLEAAWAKMCSGYREDGTDIEPNDPNWEKLTANAANCLSHPQSWMKMQSIYGDLGENVIAIEHFSKWYEMISREGLRYSLKYFINSNSN